MPDKKDPNSYLGNPRLKAPGMKIPFTQEQLDEYMKCAQDPVYFAEKYIKIVSLDKGIVPFEMRDYQKDMTRKLQNNRFVIAKCSRQSGKSATVSIFLLHTILFTPKYSVAILANKEETAKEILGKVKLAYEWLPKWLQQGILEWNKMSIVLENGSKITAAATSSSAIRGFGFNAILLDEYAFVASHLAEEFYSSVYPTISSGETTKLIIISTPCGMNNFYRLWMDAINGKNRFVTIDVTWKQVPGRDEAWKAETIANTSERQFRQEQECAFLGSVHTLIDPEKLKTLHYIDHTLQTESGLKVFHQPEKGHRYVLTLDVSQGLGLDSHAFSIMDIASLPYRQVSTFKNNTMDPLLLPTAVVAAGRQYNNAFIFIELNNGQELANTIHDDLEYENLILISHHGRNGQRYDSGFGGKRQQFGVKMSDKVKLTGCTTLKTLIEADKLLLSDFDTIQELFTFVSNRNCYEAEIGYNDDLAMSLVLFAWLTTQPGFLDLTNLNIRRDIFADKADKLEEEFTPFEIFSTDAEPEFEKTPEGLWYRDDPEKPKRGWM